MAVLKAVTNAKESGMAEGRNALLVPGIPTKNRAVAKASSRSAKSPSSSTAVRTVQKLAHKVSWDICPPAPIISSATALRGFACSIASSGSCGVADFLGSEAAGSSRAETYLPIPGMRFTIATLLLRHALAVALATAHRHRSHPDSRRSHSPRHCTPPSSFCC